MELALGRVTAGKVKRGAVYRPLAFPAAPTQNTPQSSQSALLWLRTLISLFLVSTEREAGAVIKKRERSIMRVRLCVFSVPVSFSSVSASGLWLTCTEICVDARKKSCASF